MTVEAGPRYSARLGYVAVDARRYERRRYGGLRRSLNQRMLVSVLTRALAGIAPGSLVLDMPCGTGVLAELFVRKGLLPVRADISPAMLEVASTRPGAVGHVRADVEALPWRPRTFAAVVSARFVMLLPPALRPRVLASLSALSSGPLVVTVCHPYTAKRLFRVLRQKIGMNARRLDTRLTRRELEAEAAAAGLRVERIHWVVPLFSEVWVAVLRPLHGGESGCPRSSTSTPARSSTRAASRRWRRPYVSPVAPRAWPRSRRARRLVCAR